MTVEALTCQELVELVTEYLEGVMPTTKRVRFETHLAGCSGCRNYLDQMKQTIHLAGRLTEEMLEPQTKADLLKLFNAWKKAE
jgi:predicted anti-sigma-YlaC factor YlaD